MSGELHYFRCRICSTVKVVTIKSPRMERCTCRSVMTFLFSVPIEETDEHRAIAKRGVVYNPHTATPRLPCPKCDICNLPVVIPPVGYGVVIDGLGNFCCERHADEGSARHEQAMNHPVSTGAQP